MLLLISTQLAFAGEYAAVKKQPVALVCTDLEGHLEDCPEPLPVSLGSDERVHNPAYMGSPFMPLDSWVYPMFDRLSALGYVQTGFAGLRPWTRLECARMVEEAAGLMDEEVQSGAGADYRSLAVEFAPEISLREGKRSNLDARIESVYVRVLGIGGTPLTDGFHFGQTVINDFGRPYSQGTNVAAGWTSTATAGPFVIYLRGEYQQAPAIPAYAEDVRRVLSAVDWNPVQPARTVPAMRRFELLDAYVGLNLRNTQITFGQQSLWWGPNSSGALLFSNNSRPVTMVRISQVSPFKLPGLLGRLGPWRHEFFFGQLAGHQFPAAPYIYGQKVSFKPTPNLELGFSRSTTLGGAGYPLTPAKFFRSFFSGSSTSNTTTQDPGDRRGGFDFSYRIPGLRNWLVLNVDSLVDDDLSPLAAPRRAAIAPGLYLPRVPGVSKLDLRLEAAYTDVPAGRSVAGQFIYWNNVYHDSHTQDGSLLGHWVGREGQSYTAVARYWMASRSTVALGYRNARVNGDFIPGGVTLHDVALEANLFLRNGVSVQGRLQYEHLNVPLLAIRQQANISASVQLTYFPNWRFGTKSK